LENDKKVLQVNPDANPPFSFQINDLGISNYIIKIKKIACKSLKGKGRNSGLRLVYAFYAKSDIADEKIIFIELFFKGDKEMEDRDRILKYFK
jgi:hypothetical protein